MAEYSFIARRRRKKFLGKNLPTALALCFIAIFATFFIQKAFLKTNLIDPQPTPSPPKDLKAFVDNTLYGTKGIYGIVIKDLKGGDTYTLNPDRIFEPGSLYKLWVLATVYKQIEEGNLKEEDQLSSSIPALNREFDIDPEYAELTTGGISMSVKQAMEQMITISHNYAALLLAQKIQISEVSRFLEENGLHQSEIGQPPKTTPADIALFYEKLYKRELGSPENTQKMIDILKRQQLNDGLPKSLPTGTQVAHKTGDLDWFKHDAGIVFSPYGDYIIVVLSETQSPLGAQQRIAQVSEATYKFFTK